MNVTTTAHANGAATLQIIADWSEVADDYDDVLAEYSKAALPGFRPGKAPRAVVEQRLRTQIRDDFTARCGRRLAREALGQRQLRAAGPIRVVAIESEPRSRFSFTAQFVAAPKFQLPDYSAIPLREVADVQRRDEVGEWLLAHTAGNVPEPLIRQECPAPCEPGSSDWQAAERRARLCLILQQIAEAQGIDVDQRDVEARIEKVAAQTGTRPVDLRRQLEREDGLSRLRALLRAEQTLDYLLSAAVSQS